MSQQMKTEQKESIYENDNNNNNNNDINNKQKNNNTQQNEREKEGEKRRKETEGKEEREGEEGSGGGEETKENKNQSSIEEDIDLIKEKLTNLKNEQNKMKNFLVIKSTRQQLRDGVERPVDTAYIESKDGKLQLKAVFDVNQFKPEEINVQIVDNELELKAQCLDDQENAVYRKTIVRKIGLPETVDTSKVDCVMTDDGILSVSMPFFLPKTPSSPVAPSPGLVPIVTDEDGRRYIRLEIKIGPDFTIDDVQVTSEGHSLFVKAWYEASVGISGRQVTRRELKKEFRIPESIQVESIRYDLTESGILQIEILLAELEEPYLCYVDTEDLITS